jgi:methionyl-tRNA formyltransferase
MVKTGIVSNSALCLPLLHFLKTQQEDVVVLSAEVTGPHNGAVAAFCAGAAIPCMQANGNEQALYQWAALHSPDIVFVIGYNFKIHTDRFTTGLPLLFNVHMGHLPEYRGPNPVFWQLKKGAPSLAITIHCINNRFDAGEVAWKKEYTNQPFFNYGFVHQFMSHQLVEGVSSLLQMKKQGQPVPVVAQNEGLAAYYKRPTLHDVCIQWHQMTATEIINLVKACVSWNNGAITIYNGMEVRICDAELLAPAVPNPAQSHRPGGQSAPGTIIHAAGALLVACLQHEMLKVHTLMVSGTLLPGRFAEHYGFSAGQSF